MSADISSVPASILKRKSNISRSIDSTSRHTLETNVHLNSTSTTSIVKRKTPSTQALVTVPTMPEKRFAYKCKVYAHDDRIADVGESNYEWDKWAREHPDDLDTIEDIPTSVGFRGYTKTQKMRSGGRRAKFFKDTVDYEGNPKGKFGKAQSNKARSQSQRIKVGNNLKDYDNEPIDSDYVEITLSKFKKAPLRNAKDLGLAKKSKSQEPVDIVAISANKRKVKSELLKPSKKSHNDINDRWLIDEAFDQLHDTGEAIVKATGKAAKEGVMATGKAGEAAGKAVKQGLREFNEISEIVGQNPMLIRMGQAHEATLAGMASKRRHALGSIAATGNNSLSAGSLVTQIGYVSHTNTQAVASYPTQNQVIPKVLHRKGGDQVRYFLPTGQEVSAAVARKLLHGSVSVPTQANGASTTIEHTYSRDNTNQIVKKIAKTASGLVRRNKIGSVNITHIASPSGLARKTHSEVV
jgi:hypothetical protein